MITHFAGNVALDDAVIVFSPTATIILVTIIGFVMFGVALDVKPADIRAVTKYPKAIIIALATQVVLLPLVTLGLTFVLPVSASVALGMILVASSPPGNISQILTHRAGGNVALSVTMTAISLLVYLIALPINVSFWGAMNPDVRQLLREISPDPIRLVFDVIIMILVPVTLGILVSTKLPHVATRLKPYVRNTGLFGLIAVVLVLVWLNAATLWASVGLILLVVLAHDVVAFTLGYGVARVSKLAVAERKALTFEVGIRNATIGIGIGLSLFSDYSGVTLVAMWWGLFDIFAGLLLASLWSWHTRQQTLRKSSPNSD